MDRSWLSGPSRLHSGGGGDTTEGGTSGENATTDESGDVGRNDDDQVGAGPGDQLSSDNVEIELTDINNHWAASIVRQAIELGFVKGYDDGTFRPNDPVTRAEFTVMISRVLKLEGEGNLKYTDMNQIPEWARSSVAQAAAAGIITGYEDNTFRASKKITRTEIAVIIARTLGLEIDPNREIAFADADEIPIWATPYVSAVYEAGLVHGRGNNLFAPNEYATRAEAVSLILAMIDYTKSN